MMGRRRLRAAHPPEVLRTVYSEPYDHTHHSDHLLRVAASIELARWLAATHHLTSAADLACGDGAILDAIADDIPTRYYGDLVGGPHIEAAPIEESAPRCPPVDLMILTETLEHLDEPDAVLKVVRTKAAWLVVSTPVGAFGDQNAEHYWAWDRVDVEAMLTGAGWTVTFYGELDFRPAESLYAFGLWVAR